MLEWTSIGRTPTLLLDVFEQFFLSNHPPREFIYQSLYFVPSSAVP